MHWEEVKLPLFTESTIIYVENLKQPTKNSPGTNVDYHEFEGSCRKINQLLTHQQGTTGI